MKNKKIIIWSVVTVFVIILIVFISIFKSYLNFFSDVEIIKIDDKLTLVNNGGGNSGIIESDSAVFVIDTKMRSTAVELKNMVVQKAGSKKIKIINTHWHGDHVSGNVLYKKSEIIAGAYDSLAWVKENGKEVTPTIWIKDSLIINLNGEILTLINIGQGHTLNDLVVYLNKRKVLFTGDLVFNGLHPFLMPDQGTNIKKWIDDLKFLKNRWEIKTVVPGHGKIGGIEVIDKQIEYFTDMEIAASNPQKEDEIIKKYDNYVGVKGMTSASKTISVIKAEK